MTASTGRPRILLGGSTLFSDGGGIPRPVAKARLAIQRLRPLGEPVVLVSRELGGRTLPDDERERVAWVRDSLAVPGLRVVAFEESGTGRPTDPATEQMAELWATLRESCGAGTLLTGLESSVAAARRAGLRVIRIGARGPGPDPTTPRADYEAFDLLDAVRHLLAADTFDASAAKQGPTAPGPVPGRT